jgi:outer membrane protein assembly factor BamB
MPEPAAEEQVVASGRPAHRVVVRLIATCVVVAGLWWWYGSEPNGRSSGSLPIDRRGASFDVELAQPAPVVRAAGWCVPTARGTVVTASGAPAIAAVDLSIDQLGSLGAADAPVRWRRTAFATVPGWPVVDNDLLVVGSADGSVHALDAATGQPRWSNPNGGRHRPVVARGLVVVHDGLEVRAVSRDDGAAAWSGPDDPLRRIVGTIDHVAGRVHVARTREQRDRFTNAANDVIDVLDVATGRRLARLDLVSPSDRGRPVLQDVASVGEDLVTLERGSRVVGRDPADGEPRWQLEVDSRATAIADVDGEPALLVGLDWQRIVVTGGEASIDPAVRVSTGVGGPCQVPVTWFDP